MGKKSISIRIVGMAFGCILLAGCDRAARPEGVATTTTTAASGQGTAEVGNPAPDFSLRDLDGKTISLRDYRGKMVVLEWFNPDCPFVRASHTKASLKTFPSTQLAKGVVWLAINSSAPGNAGHGAAKNAEGKKRYGMTYPVLLDESGETGKRYGATNTPHMFVIDPRGVLVYQGAIDNSPDGEGESPEGGKLVNYVGAALDAVAAGRPVTVKSTKAYGCGVKY
ncbi:thioredoxin family protein [Pendulispora rubella]|uniref:Thioredoxin family protein n=1 Tax=Pendulispora rubella TaxID=2741070 RepID=A0ABZ2KZ12_9BACT